MLIWSSGWKYFKWHGARRVEADTYNKKLHVGIYRHPFFHWISPFPSPPLNSALKLAISCTCSNATLWSQPLYSRMVRFVVQRGRWLWNRYCVCMKSDVVRNYVTDNKRVEISGWSCRKSSCALPKFYIYWLSHDATSGGCCTSG